MGRSKLDDAALERVDLAARRGLSEREIYAIVGVPERTWYQWKERAREAARVLPAQWRTLPREELEACCEELGIALSTVRRSGRRGQHTREDLIRALVDRGQRYRDLLDVMERARPERKLSILQQIEQLCEGRARIRKTRTTQRVRYEGTGPNRRAVQVGEAIVTTEEVELPPDRQALLKMLERIDAEEGHPIARAARVGGSGASELPDAGAAARELTAAVHSMLSTIQPPPEDAVK